MVEEICGATFKLHDSDSEVNMGCDCLSPADFLSEVCRIGWVGERAFFAAHVKRHAEHHYPLTP